MGRHFIGRNLGARPGVQLNPIEDGADGGQAAAAAPAPAPPPAPAAPAIGWLDPIGDPAGVAAVSNSGTAGGYNFDWPDPFYAGVVGYAGGVVAWTSQWLPTAGEPAPEVTQEGAKASVLWPPTDGGTMRSRGMLILSATVDGVPVPAGQGIEAASDDDAYTSLAWGPQP